MPKVLIGFLSKTGTTQEIAQRIAITLREQGLSVDLASLDAVTNSSAYSHILLGTPINGMKVLPEFDTFLQQQAELGAKTVGVFAVSYIYPRGRKFWRGLIQKELDRVASLVGAELKIVLGGRIPQPMPGLANFLFGLPSSQALDLRDDAQIDQWAEACARRCL